MPTAIIPNININNFIEEYTKLIEEEKINNDGELKQKIVNNNQILIDILLK